MESLLERIEENRLDALYLFINEGLRDRAQFDAFFANLLSVLPQNWSIQRVEVGHEFLGMVTQQSHLFKQICRLDSLRTLIVSDGYVQRKDNGSIQTKALLKALPKAQGLTTLDLQRVCLEDVSPSELADVLESLQDSLEELRFTSIVSTQSLDPIIITATEGLPHLKSLTLSTDRPVPPTTPFMSQTVLQNLLHSTTLQDLSLRSMHLTNEDCKTMASSLATNLFLTSLDIRQNPRIDAEGYTAILKALERNYDLWCSVLVSDEAFQGKFNALIELNQAGRGDVLRRMSLEKVVNFVSHLDATALWFCLCIHESIRDPLVSYLSWKETFQQQQSRKRDGDTTDASVKRAKVE